jgi:hypothetical protein
MTASVARRRDALVTVTPLVMQAVISCAIMKESYIDRTESKVNRELENVSLRFVVTPIPLRSFVITV